jgi:hypothetical protein
LLLVLTLSISLICILRFKILGRTEIALEIKILLQIFIINRFHSRERIKVWIKLRILFRLTIPYLFKYIILKYLFTSLLWYDLIAEIKLVFDFLIEIHLIKLRLKILLLNWVAEEILRLLLLWCISFEKIIDKRILIYLFRFNFHRNSDRLLLYLNIYRLRW